MSNSNPSPKKKAAAKKPVAKKAAPKKAADGAKKTPAKRGRPPKKKLEQAPVYDPLADTVEDITNAVEAMFEEVKDGASEITETVKDTIDNVIRASDVIKPTLRKRMLAWFKRK
jgi:hypothetical protein